jgi:hypothetical protein
MNVMDIQTVHKRVIAVLILAHLILLAVLSRIHRLLLIVLANSQME